MHFAIFFGAILVVVVQGAYISDPIKCRDDLDIRKQHVKCAGKSICHMQHPDYPRKCIDRLLSEKYHLQIVQADQVFSVPRDAEEEYHDNDCPKKDKHNTAIYQIIDENNKLRVVVQSKHFNQTIQTESCEKPGKQLIRTIPTDHFTPEHMRENYIYSEQILLDYNFLVLSTGGTGVEYVKCRDMVPVACTCRVKMAIKS